MEDRLLLTTIRQLCRMIINFRKQQNERLKKISFFNLKKNVSINQMKSKLLNTLKTKIEEHDGIANSSKTAYLSRINTLEKADHFPFKSQEGLLDLIEELNPNDNLNTELNIITSLFIFMELSAQFKKLFTEEMVQDLQIQQDILSTAKKEKVNEERDGDMSWDKLQSFKSEADKLKRDERLLYYLYINPGIGFVPRNDFSNMKIVDDTEEADDKKFNYYVKDTNQFVLNEYKTAKKYGRILVDVPQETVEIIERNKHYVFEDANNGPIRENTLQHKIARSLKRITGVNVTINNIRRSFATHISDLPDRERVKIAHKMGHSGHTSKNVYSLKK